MASPDRAKLIRAMARLVAHRKQIAERRRQLADHAAAMLDHERTRVRVASEHLAAGDNPLVYRYARAHMTEAHRLAGIVAPAERARADE